MDCINYNSQDNFKPSLIQLDIRLDFVVCISRYKTQTHTKKTPPLYCEGYSVKGARREMAFIINANITSPNVLYKFVFSTHKREIKFLCQAQIPWSLLYVLCVKSICKCVIGKNLAYSLQYGHTSYTSMNHADQHL
jgi:hypothetical protein